MVPLSPGYSPDEGHRDESDGRCQDEAEAGEPGDGGRIRAAEHGEGHGHTHHLHEGHAGKHSTWHRTHKEGGNSYKNEVPLNVFTWGKVNTHTVVR